MIVTRSRLHAVRTKIALDGYLAEKGHPWKALVAFSGAVKDGGESYTESGMNSAGQELTISDRQTAAEFEKLEYRFLVVASKFQTGFDQPLLHTMYVDKKLGGVNAVQTLSRLNRTHPGKQGTMVLDFANEADEIKKAFEPYYETTLLSEETDPNLLYEVQGRLLDFGVFAAADVESFAHVYFDPRSNQDRFYAALEPARQRFIDLDADEGGDFRGQLTDYVRLYSFLSQVLTFADPDLEKLYVFARHLRRLLPADKDELPREVQQNIDMESFRIQRTSRGRIKLERHGEPLEPAGSKPRAGGAAEELEALSRIIEAPNERFGLNLGPEHRVTLEQIRAALEKDAGLDASARVNTRDDRKVLGIEHDRLDNDDKFMRHLAQAVRNGLGDRAGTCIDPKTQIVEGRTLCLVSCQRSPEPVYLRWKGVERIDGGDLYVRTGPGSVRLGEEDAKKYVATRFPSR